jgi:hypothetical protein
MMIERPGRAGPAVPGAGRVARSTPTDKTLRVLYLLAEKTPFLDLDPESVPPLVRRIAVPT